MTQKSVSFRSASQRIENASKVNAEKVQQIQDQAQQSNVELFRLMNDIHAAVSNPIQHAVSPEPMLVDDSSPTPAADTSYRGLSFRARLASSTSTSPTPFPEPGHSNLSQTPQQCQGVAPHLSSDLLEINKSRSAIGQEQFLLFGRQNRIPQAVPIPVSGTDPNSIFGVGHPTVLQVAAELEKIVVKMGSRINRTSTLDEVMTQRLHRWLQGFEAIVQSWSITSAPTRVEKQRRQKDGHALMLNLNSKISQVNGPARKNIYKALENDGIERIFQQLRESLRSVAVEKEIQLYEDENETL